MNQIAKEFALDLAEGSFEPSLISLLPCIANGVADKLSRGNDPKHSRNSAVPEFPASARHVVPLPRPRAWWRSLETPA